MKFKLQLGDITNNYRATASHRFYSDAFWSSEDAGYKYFVDGLMVTRLKALESAQLQMEADYNKKLKTHKRVTVYQGATTLSSAKKEIWVKR